MRAAATVVLLRTTGSGPEVFLLHRVGQMAFAGGMTVFPGGGVDPVDSAARFEAGWLRGWAARWGVDEPLASQVAAAAVRELQEETGVLLPATALRPWARWITPAGQPRRYDTFFVVAELAAGETPQLTTTEAHSAGWWRPAEALDAARAGRLAMLPPTVAVLTDLASCTSLDEILAAERDLAPVQPVLLSGPGEPARVDIGGRTVEALGVAPPPPAG